MSDLESERPLSRRERRLQEMVDSGAAKNLEEAQKNLLESTVDEPHAPDDEINISPVDESGRPRTRREMRLLREQALARRAESAPKPEPGVPSPAEPEPVPEPAAAAPAVTPEATDAGGVAEPGAEASDEDPEPIVEPEPEPQSEPMVSDADVTAIPDEALEATQPFTLDDLRDIETAVAHEGPVDGGVYRPTHTDQFMAAETVTPSSDEETAGAETVQPDDEALTEAEADAAPAPVAASATYSFPDIAPLDEPVSVLDDPASRAVPSDAGSAAEESGDFDDLISRAVAQESATSTTNTSALILPNMPDTAALSGPLGGTGELFITGSISLPKSLGETGGHAPMIAGLDADHLDDLDYNGLPATRNPILPVSATRAVSAVGSTGAPVVTQETKEKSKLPIVLIATGGGLVIAVGALLIWGASSGLFG